MKRTGLEPVVGVCLTDLQSAPLPIRGTSPYALKKTRTSSSETSVLCSNLLSYRGNIDTIII